MARPKLPPRDLALETTLRTFAIQWESEGRREPAGVCYGLLSLLLTGAASAEEIVTMMRATRGRQ